MATIFGKYITKFLIKTIDENSNNYTPYEHKQIHELRNQINELSNNKNIKNDQDFYDLLLKTIETLKQTAIDHEKNNQNISIIKYKQLCECIKQISIDIYNFFKEDKLTDQNIELIVNNSKSTLLGKATFIFKLVNIILLEYFIIKNKELNISKNFSKGQFFEFLSSYGKKIQDSITPDIKDDKKNVILKRKIFIKELENSDLNEKIDENTFEKIIIKLKDQLQNLKTELEKTYSDKNSGLTGFFQSPAVLAYNIFKSATAPGKGLSDEIVCFLSDELLPFILDDKKFKGLSLSQLSDMLYLESKEIKTLLTPSSIIINLSANNSSASNSLTNNNNSKTEQPTDQSKATAANDLAKKKSSNTNDDDNNDDDEDDAMSVKNQAKTAVVFSSNTSTNKKKNVGFR